MQKLWLIIRREYLTRVRKKSFILGTLLTPILLGVFFMVVGLIFSYEGDESKTIAIIDEGNILEKKISDTKNLYFQFPNKDLQTLKTAVENGEFDGILVIPKLSDLYVKDQTVYYYSHKPPSVEIESVIEKRIERSIRDYKIASLALDKTEIDALNTNVSIDPEPLKDTDTNASKMTSAIGAMLGMFMGLIMYTVMFVYGMMVMRSVMEEKTTRIVEVMISSVKPFQLMLGKIIGVGAVGLTQILIWAILIPAITIPINMIFGFNTTDMGGMEGAAAQVDPDDMQAMVSMAITELENMNWWLILPLFVIYFLGGYFLYSSMFAAVGSAIGDDMGEGQSLTLPITIPVVLALYIMIASLESPDSSLAVWSSIFPLFSPVVMPARLAFDPPMWQILLSVAVLIGTVILFVWLAGRIYRVGILLYGKKASFPELVKWIFRRA
ncbi:MAG: ABC transporter permease [Saprospiraceae bacterium]|nr:ABC transporter permease [Saprospiraceae bacterium]